MKLLGFAAVAAAALATLSACAADGDHGLAVLEANGLHNIEFNDSANPLLDCQAFTATTYSGKPVSGDICYSWIEGQVVSFD